MLTVIKTMIIDLVNKDLPKQLGFHIVTYCHMIIIKYQSQGVEDDINDDCKDQYNIAAV